MITVSTFDDARGRGLWLVVRGHASCENETERTQICAGVSVLLKTLGTYGLDDEHSYASEAVDGDGLVSVLVPVESAPAALFVFKGLALIEVAYPGQVAFDYRDSGRTEQERYLWTEAPTRPTMEPLPRR